MTVTAADVRRIVREELRRELTINPEAVRIGLRRSLIRVRLNGLRGLARALRAEAEEHGLDLHESQIRRLEQLVDEFTQAGVGLDGRSVGVDGSRERLLMARGDGQVLHGEPPCGCGDDTVGGPDPGDPSGSGSGPDGGAS